MSGAGGLIGLVVWGLFAAWNASQKAAEKKRSSPTPKRPAPSPRRPPPVPTSGDVKPLLKRVGAASSSLRGLEEPLLADDHAELRAGVSAALSEAGELEDELRRAAASAEGAASSWRRLATRVESLSRRAAFLRRLLEARGPAESGRWMRGLAVAIESAVPGLDHRAIVLRGSDGELAPASLRGSGLAPYFLTADPLRQPWAAASLVEDAWATVLLGDDAQARAATQRAGEEARDGDAMERFASGLAQAWAPALLLDAACCLSLGSGHAARVRALAERLRPDELFLIRLNESRQVDGVPPVGLRLMLLRHLLARGGGPQAPPLPPNPVLHLRGPGVWDQVALRPVLEQAARVQAAFAEELSSRAGLQDSRGIDARARELLEENEDRPVSRHAEPRALLAALALCASLPNPLPRARRLLDGLTPTKATAASPRPPNARPGATGRGRSLSRRRAFAEAVLLGESFSGPRT